MATRQPPHRVSAVPSGVEPPSPPPDVIGNAFTQMYYNILINSPEMVHMFYRENSRLTRLSAGGGTAEETVTTCKAIYEKVMAMETTSWTTMEVEQVVSNEDSTCGGIIVLVTGSHATPNNRRRRFLQTFFLAPQKGGYYVEDDTFSYIDGGAGPATSTQGSLMAPADHGSSDGEMFWTY